MSSAILNSIGLFLILVGASVLWWITPVYGGGAAFWWDPQLQAKINQVVKRKTRLARCGFGLICLGTLVQIAALWLDTFGLIQR